MHPLRLIVAAWTLVLCAAVVLFYSVAQVRSDEPNSLFVEGYAKKVSYDPGETLTLHVSTSAPEFSAEMVRVGAEKVAIWSRQWIPGHEYPVPENASSNGCDWPVALEIPIPSTQRTGYYEVHFRVRDRGGKFVQRNLRQAEGSCFFIVRPADPGKQTKILLQLASNTYNAYNNWGGFSLYAYHGYGGNQGHRVSFERPPNSLFDKWERPFVEWAERNGYLLDFAANNDLEFHPEMLKAYNLVLSVGHDEYWSAPMRDNLEAYIGSGGNVAFFSGNTCCWQVRNEDEGQALTSWKQNLRSDPVYQAHGMDTNYCRRSGAITSSGDRRTR